MSLVGNISGSSSYNSNIGISGSVVIANRPDALFPTLSSVGGDVVFFVSGSRGGKGLTAERTVAVFGGDTVVSGTLTIGTGSVAISSNDITFFGGAAQILSGSGGLTLKDSAGQVTVTQIIAGLTPAPVYWTSITANEIFTTGSAVVSGSITSKDSSGKIVFNFNPSTSLLTTVSGTFSGDVTVQGDLTVNGTTTTVNTENLLVEDPVIYFGSGSVGSNRDGGIALASGSSVTSQALVWGRVSQDTWGSGRLDVQNGTVTNLTGMTLTPIRASRYEVDGLNDALKKDGSFLVVSASSTSGIQLQHGPTPQAVNFRSDNLNYLVVGRDGAGNSVINAMSNRAYLSGSQINLVASGSTGNANFVFGVDTSNTFLQIQSGSGGFAGARIESVNNALTVQAPAGQSLFLAGNNNNVAQVGSLTIDGTPRQGIFPVGDKAQYLGGPFNRWANIYTGDLHLRNERGDYTLIEEEDFLSIRFNKTGKRYKFVLEPVPELDEK